jgi:two-component system CheB/CheR fusion protein
MAKRKNDSRKVASKVAAGRNKAAGSDKATAGKNNVPGSKKKTAGNPKKAVTILKKAVGGRQTSAGGGRRAGGGGVATSSGPKRKAVVGRPTATAGGGPAVSGRTKARAGGAQRPGVRPQKSGAAVRKTHEAVPIVGIGASAGGLEAFTQLLGALPADTGMAFVMVSHLSHTHKSMLTELLAKATAMAVSQVVETTPVVANRVYVIPPNMNLSISDGAIEVSPISAERRAPQAIDFFFRSLAESHKSRAIGVLLSGTGSDGTLGLTAIKAEGGITFAQDDASARYADMPRSAALAGAADFVLPPEQIAVEITRIALHPYVDVMHGAPAVEEETSPDSLSQVFGLVRGATGVDFSVYKPTTIKRRVARRMLLHKIDRMDGYVSFLQTNPKELDALYQDLLINVTGFFRDADAFQFLQEEIIPKLVTARPSDAAIRVWVPGCATGEEAYSMAICLLEALSGYGPNPPLQIFATDVSEAAVKRAREGIYQENVAIDLSPERLRRFFVKLEGGYQISKQVRDLCVFAPQNLVKDPPFSRMDLISCRNVLIYLGAPPQRRVLSTFHYALKPGGFLMLGASETTGAAAELFEQVSKKQKVYVKLQTSARLQYDLPTADAESGTRGAAKKVGVAAQQPPDVSKEADRIVLTRYAPPGVIVNSAFEIVQFRGRTSRFLEPSPGEASLNLFRMARQGLVIDLRAAVHQAKKSGATVSKQGLQVRVDGAIRTVDLEVIPLGGGNAAEACYMILFDDATAGQRPAAQSAAPESRRLKSGAAAAEKELQSLRKELAATQEDLHSIIEEQEASNEELQSANEEILSANEELQSTNEEMETAKEELQATNEELTTVNEELQNRIAELSLANNDLQNLIAVSDVVMVMVGQDLRIRRITPGAQSVLNLIAADIGRPLGNIKTNLKVSNLESLMASVIDKITPVEREIQDVQGRWYSMRIRPYRTEDNKIVGAVMVLVDIDRVKGGEETEGVWRVLVDPLPDFILSGDPEGKVLFLNRTVASLAKQVALGGNIYDFIDRKDHASLTRCLRKVIASGTAATFETSRGRERGGPGLVTRLGPIKSQGQVVALTMTSGVPLEPAADGR